MQRFPIQTDTLSTLSASHARRDDESFWDKEYSTREEHSTSTDRNEPQARPPTPIIKPPREPNKPYFSPISELDENL